MRCIPKPKVRDGFTLSKLNTSKAIHAKAIVGRAADVMDRYITYTKAGGNPWVVPIDTSYDEAIASSFHSLYERPPVALNFIKLLREQLDGACPMCGRDGLGTLDHYLPKAIFPEFSFLSRNLVPACANCNSKRKDTYKGINTSQRPIHPYYDKFVKNRVLSIEFLPDWRAPLINPVPFGVLGLQQEMVEWHIENIIKPSGIVKYLSKIWGKLVVNPTLHLGKDKSIVGIRERLHELEQRESDLGCSPNGWRSSFYHGLSLNDDALSYLSSIMP